MRVRELLAAVGERPLPGAGSVAAVVAGLAAGLVRMAADASRETWPEAGAVVAQAAALRDRLEPLAELDAETYTVALRTIEERLGDAAILAALTRAADAPLRIAEAAADVAALAAHAAERCELRLRADVTAAGTLAAAAASAAAELVAVNLTAVEDDPRVERARAAAASAARALPG